MKKVLLLATLCTALVSALALGAPAMAQSASASAPSGTPLPASGECPAGTQPFSPSGTGDDTQCITDAQLGDYLRAIGEGGATRPSTASPSAGSSASASAPAEGVSCDGFTTISGEPSQFQAQQFFDFTATEEEQAVLDPDGNGFACDGGEIEFGGGDGSTASALASASASALPDTGGPDLAGAVALPMLVLLAAGGIFAARLVRG